MSQPILITDFDGTIIRRDFSTDVLAQLVPLSEEEAWGDFFAGRVNHFPALRDILKQIRCSEKRLVKLISELDLDPAFPTTVRTIAERGWRTLVCSAGCTWYIHRLLDQYHLPLEVMACPGTFAPETGLIMRLPEPGPFFSEATGIDKAAVVRHHIEAGRMVAFAGDGRPDFAAAMLVPPHLRFACGWLAGELTRRQEPFVAFKSWSEIQDTLLAQTPNPAPL